MSLSYDEQTGIPTGATLTGDTGSITESMVPGEPGEGYESFTIEETGLPSLSGSYTYDEAGRTKTMTMGGEVTSMSYEGGELVGMDTPDEKVSVVYEDGEPSQITKNSVATTIATDALGRLTSLTGGGGKRSFRYGAGRRVTGIDVEDDVYGAISSERYGHDAAGRINSVAVGGLTKDYSYFPDGQVRQVRYDGATHILVERDGIGRIVGEEFHGGFVRVEHSDYDNVADQPRRHVLRLSDGSTVTTQRAYDARYGGVVGVRCP